MSDNQAPAPEKKLTTNDPVAPEQIKRLEELTAARFDLADRLLEMEQQRVQILIAAKQVDDEKSRIFNAILMERGLPPGTPLEINGQTGAITFPAPPRAQA